MKCYIERICPCTNSINIKIRRVNFKKILKVFLKMMFHLRYTEASILKQYQRSVFFYHSRFRNKIVFECLSVPFSAFFTVASKNTLCIPSFTLQLIIQQYGNNKCKKHFTLQNFIKIVTNQKCFLMKFNPEKKWPAAFDSSFR